MCNTLERFIVLPRTGPAGFEPSYAAVKVLCLTAWRWPIVTATILPVGWLEGLEPSVSRTTIWRVNQLRYSHHHNKKLKKRMCPKGFEPPTHGLEGRCSIQLSYGHILIELCLGMFPMARTSFGRTSASALLWDAPPDSKVPRQVSTHGSH